MTITTAIKHKERSSEVLRPPCTTFLCDANLWDHFTFFLSLIFLYPLYLYFSFFPHHILYFIHISLIPFFSFYLFSSLLLLSLSFFFCLFIFFFCFFSLCFTPHFFLCSLFCFFHLFSLFCSSTHSSTLIFLILILFFLYFVFPSPL